MGIRQFFRSVRHRVGRGARSLFGIPAMREVTIERNVLDNLSFMARQAHPKEMLAFFASTRGVKNGILHIDEIQLQAYDASQDSANVFLSNLPMTTSIVGTVHSHPGGSRRPSEADLHLFSKFGIFHAIIGEPYRIENISFYDRSGSRAAVRIVGDVTGMAWDSGKTF